MIRCKLPFGDYSMPPKVAVDTKENIDEICNNILVENECGITDVSEVHTWVNPRVIYSPKCPQGKQLEKAMRTLTERYGVLFYFCTPADSGKRVLELLEAYEHG